MFERFWEHYCAFLCLNARSWTQKLKIRKLKSKMTSKIWLQKWVQLPVPKHLRSGICAQTWVKFTKLKILSSENWIQNWLQVLEFKSPSAYVFGIQYHTSWIQSVIAYEYIHAKTLYVHKFSKNDTLWKFYPGIWHIVKLPIQHLTRLRKFNSKYVFFRKKNKQ